MSFILPRLSKALTYGLGIGLASTTLLSLHQPQSRRLLQCDAALAPTSSPKDWSFSQYQSEARAPVVRKDGSLNPSAVRQITKGSILGVCAGIAVSMFSKSLALLFGLLIIGVQAAESRGIHIIPYNRLQKYFTNIDLRSAVQDNVAFKLSFGATFALAGFARLSE
ncbi:hypothetical protein BDV97DRAFT_357269 [Delphinella strobiligena]|nr:hypothetical protein BDV97DRAFT_357269 [Delphinella strobiligena]